MSRSLCIGAVSAASLLLSSGQLGAEAGPQGRYVFRLEPAPECQAPAASYSFRVEARPNDGRRPGVQVGLDGARLAKAGTTGEPILEMELLYSASTLAGSIATMPWQDSGVRSQDGTYVWIQGVATGAVIRRAVGTVSDRGPRYEVREGTLLADLSFGRERDDRDGLGQCVAALSRWSLQAR